MAKSKTCKNCIFWKNGVCDYVNTIFAEKEPKFYLQIEAQNDQGIFVELHTSANFGCVNFKEK